MPSSYIRRFSSAILAAMGVSLVYYLYRALGFLIEFYFLDHNLWEKHHMVRGDVMIPMWLRVSYFLAWMAPISATAFMLLVTMYLTNLIRSGGHFSIQMIRALQRVGVSAVIAGVKVMAATSVWAWMITYQNVVERRSPYFYYDSAQAGIILLGVGIFMLGWVLKTALLMRQENEEFV
ncbi:MAG: DUF2975 domain-containing protein [Amylibacter sp.]